MDPRPMWNVHLRGEIGVACRSSTFWLAGWPSLSSGFFLTLRGTQGPCALVPPRVPGTARTGSLVEWPVAVGLPLWPEGLWEEKTGARCAEKPGLCQPWPRGVKFTHSSVLRGGWDVRDRTRHGSQGVLPCPHGKDVINLGIRSWQREHLYKIL